MTLVYGDLIHGWIVTGQIPCIGRFARKIHADQYPYDDATIVRLLFYDQIKTYRVVRLQ